MSRSPDGPPPMSRDALDTAVGLARALRAAGLAGASDRVAGFVAALAALDPTSRRDVYWAGRLTLCAGAGDLDRYDRVFEAYFGDRTTVAGAAPRPEPGPPAAHRRPPLAVAVADVEPEPGRRPAPPAVAVASPLEVLRHRDLAELTAADRRAVHRLLAAFAGPGPTRRSRRYRPAGRGGVDRPRTTRALLAAGGEPVRPPRRTRRRRPRRVVLLVDVSGSMAAYAEALLRFGHAAVRGWRGTVEVFTVGTRLTRVTRELAAPDVEVALARVSAAVADWSGGTRLGALLAEFLDRWGRRGMARGAVVVLLSDGWERGDAALLGGQMARLHRLAHRVVWANPRKSRPGYAPLAAGMAAALPHLDAFVSGHSLAALERLAEVVAADA